MDHRDTVRAYYDAIDGDEYDRLRGLLADDFTQERGDLRLDGPDTFVAFMREGRPDTDTIHELSTLYTNGDGVAAEGVLRRASGETLFAFVDVFRCTEPPDGRLCTLTTYTHPGP